MVRLSFRNANDNILKFQNRCLGRNNVGIVFKTTEKELEYLVLFLVLSFYLYKSLALLSHVFSMQYEFSGRGHWEDMTTTSPANWSQAIRGSLPMPPSLHPPPILEMYILPNVPIVGATALRGQCVVETFWMVYMTEPNSGLYINNWDSGRVTQIAILWTLNKTLFVVSSPVY